MGTQAIIGNEYDYKAMQPKEKEQREEIAT